MSGSKTKLVMTRYHLRPGGTIQLEPGVQFEALLNPADYKHSFGISYAKPAPLGAPAANPEFNAVEGEKVSFALVLDGTGALPGSGREPVPVKTHLTQLGKVVYQYVGDKHEPPHVRLLWGSLIFFGRMESMSTQYTLFKPSGEPLRAKVDLSFVGSMSKEESKLVSNRSSPDLSRRVLVREGDTLPLLCDRIYGDPGYYIDVARFNGLADFRRLEPGRQLHFPPLE